MIEFLPPRDGAFGESDTADFVGVDGEDVEWGDEPPRSRWLTALAVLGVTGLLVGGVVAASPWSGDDAAPAPSTTIPSPAASTTVPRATTTTDPDDAPLPEWLDDSIPGWVLPEGGRFELAGANSFTDDQFGIGDPYDVWVSEGATRTSGTWLVVSSMRQQGDYQTLRPNAERIDVDGAPALVSVDDDGVLRVMVDRPDTYRFELTAGGIPLERLLEIAREVQVELNGAGYGDLLDADLRLDGMRRRVTREATSGYGPLGLTPMASTSYVDPTTGQWVEITMAPRDDDRLLTADLMWSTRVDDATLSADDLDRLGRLRRLGLEAEVRRSLPGSWWPAAAVVWPSVDGTMVSVTGDLDVSTLLDLSVQAVRAAPRQWQAAVRVTARGYEGPIADPPVVQIGGDDIAQWQAMVRNDRLEMYGNGFSSFEPFDPPSGPSLTVYRSLTTAVLIATNTWPNDGLQIVVTQPRPSPDDTDHTDAAGTTGTTGTTTPAAGVAPGEPTKLVQILDRPVYAAAVQIDPDLPFSVTWFDVEGTPVDGPAR